jgi:hypothetical protein
VKHIPAIARCRGHGFLNRSLLGFRDQSYVRGTDVPIPCAGTGLRHPQSRTEYLTKQLKYKSRDSSVGIALGYELDDRDSRVRFPEGTGNFCLHHRVQNGSEAHQASYPMGTRDTFMGVKQPGREADHSPPSSAEVKECVELYLHSQYAFMACCLVKHRDNFTFYLYQGVS